MLKNKKKIILGIMAVVVVFAVAVGAFNSATKVNAKTENKITCVDDLPGASIGVQLGTTADIYASDYEGDDAGTQIERYNKGADAIQALLQNKIDCVMIDEQPAKAFVKKNPSLVILDEAFADEEYAFAIAQNNAALTAEINEALAALKEDGTIDSIIHNYIGTDEEIGKSPYVKKDVERTKGTLVVATNATFPPYEYYENDAIVGIDMDIMQALCDEMGYELSIEDMEFDSIITAVQSGKADVGAAGMTVTDERKQNVDFSDSYTTAKQVIVVPGDGQAASLSFSEKFHQNFIEDNRYMYLLKGLVNTIVITIFALLIGIVFGSLLAIVRTTHDRNGGLNI